MANGLTSGGDALAEATKRYFADHYHNPAMKFSSPVVAKLGYAPTIQFKIHHHLLVLVEVSESPYPAILSLRRTDIEDLQMPIAVYCACPEEAYLADQAESKRLVEHGFGLITIGSDGQAQRRSPAIPLIQRISNQEFKNALRGLPRVIRRRLTEAFDRYTGSPPGGVADIAEVLEGLILQAGREAVKKTWIDAKHAKAGYSAETLDALMASKHCGPAASAIGSARGFVHDYRNISHHFPKNAAQAATKYRDCRHAFLDGLRRVSSFRIGMRACHLSGSLPSIN